MFTNNNKNVRMNKNTFEYMLEIMFFSDKIEIVNELFKRMKRGVNI